ncbi:MAG TPA: phosphoribosylaminoimidazolesuccinocarboxamide synthase [Gammaproteobacteria bacterium]|nr:phosphoribosylaminoimidazolesuccinocarboxamide synthase [Gammaproteobacteria bacterium]
MAAEALFESNLSSLPLIARGKVRDIYRVDAKRLLIVATDRMSAFDVVLPDPIPGKGVVLTAISNFWFAKLANVLPNHLTGVDPSEVLSDQRDRAVVKDRAVVVHDLKALPIEAVVRGYLIGSGWKDYCKTGRVSGVALPPGLELAERLREPIFTPSTKAARGEHDENISMAEARNLLGTELARQVADRSLELYARATEHARQRGIIIADTKFEFGLDENGQLRVMDEVLTPDSSRFWPADSYRPGSSPPSFDKQYVRDYLETLDWNKTAPGPHLPAVVIERTRAKYVEALQRLTGDAPA